MTKKRETAPNIPTRPPPPSRIEAEDQREEVRTPNQNFSFGMSFVGFPFGVFSYHSARGLRRPATQDEMNQDQLLQFLFVFAFLLFLMLF
jgi:hypothetical protein